MASAGMDRLRAAQGGEAEVSADTDHLELIKLFVANSLSPVLPETVAVITE
jgi:hypothetical protein